MKVLLPGLIAVLFLGCDMEKLMAPSEAATPAPTPIPATPQPTPKPGDWRIKDYKNPLDSRKR